MHVIGSIVRLQIQRSPLKTGEKPNRVYDPAPLLTVDRLMVSADGTLGFDRDRWIVDVHHRAHPDTRNSDGRHGISIGFTSHYEAMRERFGDRIAFGCAGENVIVETPRRFTLDDLRGGIAVLRDGTEVVRLATLDVAHPCKPFTGWALGRTVESEVLKANLQFLDGGTRGFRLAGGISGELAIGDSVAVVPTEA